MKFEFSREKIALFLGVTCLLRNIVITKMTDKLFEGDEHSKIYALYRPTPPISLIEEILEKVPQKGLALDVGCGTGQNTRILAPYFGKVLGLDISETQIKIANENPLENVEFK